MRRVAAVAVAGVLLAGAGCSTQVTARPVPPGVHSGGKLVVGILAPQTVAPWLTSSHDPYGSLIVQTMCDQLLALDPSSAKLIPSIASGFRYQKADDVILKLRTNAVFPDGSKVTGADIADSISRAARSDVGSPVASVLNPILGWQNLQGLQKVKKTRDKYRQRLAGISMPDPSSLEISLSYKDPDAFRLLAHLVSSVLPSKAYNKDASAVEHKPECVGPYSLAKPWRVGARTITLNRSAHYVPSNDAFTGSGRGFFDSIDFRVLPDASALAKAYAARTVDVAFLPTGRGVGVPGTDIVSAPTPTLHYLGLPTTKAPFDNPLVRIALSAATDRQAVAAAVPGKLRAAARFLPPTLGPAYADGSKSSCPRIVSETANLAEAKFALAKAHVDLTGTSVKVLYNDEYDNKAIIAAAVKPWSELGLKVELVQMPWANLTDLAGRPAGLSDAFRFAWRPQVSDPAGYLRPLFNSTQIGQQNWSKFALPVLDKLLDKRAERELDAATRVQDFLDAESLTCAEMPMIPLAEGVATYAVRKDKLSSASGRFTDTATGALVLRELYFR